MEYELITGSAPQEIPLKFLYTISPTNSNGKEE